MNEADQATIDFVGDVGESILSTEERSLSTGPMVGSISGASSTSSVYNEHEIDCHHIATPTKSASAPIEVMEQNNSFKSKEQSIEPPQNDHPQSPPRRYSPTIIQHDSPPTTAGIAMESSIEKVSPKVNRPLTQHPFPPEPPKYTETIVSETPVNFDFNPQLMMKYQQILMQQHHFHQMQQPYMQATNQQPSTDHQTNISLQANFLSQGPSNHVAEPKRRVISLRLLEEERQDLTKVNRFSKDDSSMGTSRSFFFQRPRRFRSMSTQSVFSDVVHESPVQDSSITNVEEFKLIERGTLCVSWYEGTSSAELQEHVRKSLCRKLSLKPHMKLINLRILDERIESKEEIVLSPYIPDGSKFLLRFEIEKTKMSTARNQQSSSPVRLDNILHLDSLVSRAPDSPSAAPSPFPSSVDLEKLQQQIGAVLSLNGNSEMRTMLSSRPVSNSNSVNALNKCITEATHEVPDMDNGKGKLNSNINLSNELSSTKMSDNAKLRSNETIDENHDSEEKQDKKLSSSTDEKKKNRKKKEKSDDVIVQRIIELNELLLLGREKSERFENYRSLNMGHIPRQEKRQVIFIIANYFVLFLSLIAISAEFHERAPKWFEWIQTNVTSVQNCAADRDALFECVSNGDFSGLIASLILWASKSASTKRIFLFGFDDKIKLWTVVYESGVTAICWGTSYMFIRRGLNPDTRERFLQKYWKDAVYGSLAGFNAAFMKAVLKNMVPQDQVLDVFEKRQIKIVHFLAQLFSKD